MTEPVSRTRYYDLLGRAYEVPLESTAFEALLDTAHDFFCVDPETGKIGDDVPRFDGADIEMDGHTARLAQIFDIALKAGEADADAAERYHAILTLNTRTGIVEGNGAAVSLLECDLPCAIGELPFDAEAIQHFRQAMAEETPQERIVLALAGEDEARPCLAVLQPDPENENELTISLSFVEWSPPLIARLGRALGLTESETDVLAGFLGNKSSKEIAEDRGRSPETIKVQSKTILRKTGCARMADVVRLSASIAYLLKKMPDAPPVTLDDWTTPTANMKTLKRGGRTIAYYRHGTGGTVAVFCHALIQGPFFAAPFRARLAEAGITLIAVSRPGYGYTSPPVQDNQFEATTVRDVLAVLDAEGADHAHIIGHQLGTSHAFRIAAALGARAKSLTLVNGGIPLNEAHYASMDRRVRFAALATRHAPSIMKMTNALGVRSFRKKGVRSFLIDRYQTSEADMRALQDPDAMQLHAYGTFHACQQGGIPFMLDQKSKHANWTGDVLAAECPQFWLQPGACSILAPEAVKDFVESLHGARFEIEPGASAIMLYERPRRVADFMAASIETVSQRQAESR